MCGAERASHRQGQATPTFTGRLGHLELDEELFQLFSHGGSSDKTLVIQEMFLTPLGALVVLQRGHAEEKVTRSDSSADARPNRPNPISKAEGNNQTATCCPSPTFHTSKPRGTDRQA